METWSIKDETKKPEFSGMAFRELAELNQVEETCDVHGTNLVKYQDKAAFCLNCAQAKVEKTEQDLVYRAIASYENKERKWLAERSILSDNTIKRATFDSFEAKTEEEKHNKQATRLMANDFRNGTYYNVLMSGNAGAGKSHLAMSMLRAVNEFSEEPKKCLFVSVGEVVRKIQDSFNNPESHFTQERTITMLQQPDVLVLDDLGAESGAIKTSKAASDFVNRVLVQVFDGRQDKATITTTNLNSEQVNLMYDERFISRLYRGISREKGLLTFKETTDKRNNLTF